MLEQGGDFDGLRASCWGLLLCVRGDLEQGLLFKVPPEELMTQPLLLHLGDRQVLCCLSSSTVREFRVPLELVIGQNYQRRVASEYFNFYFKKITNKFEKWTGNTELIELELKLLGTVLQHVDDCVERVLVELYWNLVLEDVKQSLQICGFFQNLLSIFLFQEEQAVDYR